MLCQHCSREAVARGLCNLHYKRQLRGAPMDQRQIAAAGEGATICIRMSRDDRAQIEAAADAAGKQLSEFCRDVLLKGSGK